MVKSGIYVIVEKSKGRAYFGSSIDVFKRWKKHKWELGKGIHHNKFLQNSWNKYGGNMFLFAFIEPVIDRELLLKREKAWVDFVKDTLGLGGNLFNEVLNIGEANLFNRRKPVISEERRKSLSEKMKGNKYASGKGHSPSEEVRKRISDKLKGVIHSVESYKRASDKKKGRKHSPESIAKMKMSQSKRSDRGPNRIKINKKIGPGKAKGSKSWKAKLNEDKVLKIRDLSLTGVSGIELSRKFGVTKSVISAIINRKTWKHV